MILILIGTGIVVFALLMAIFTTPKGGRGPG